VFAALKPGGTYIVTDYVAAAGSGMRDTQSLHRIDPEVITCCEFRESSLVGLGAGLAGQPSHRIYRRDACLAPIIPGGDGGGFHGSEAAAEISLAA
jgi:hypothetical protein